LGAPDLVGLLGAVTGPLRRQRLPRNIASHASLVACRHSYNLVLHKHGELLYNGVCDTVAAHLHEERTKVCAQPDELLLAALRQTFERHVVNMRMIRDILMYMVRACGAP